MTYTVNVVSNEGHTTLEFSSKEDLVTRVKELAGNDNSKKWIYVDSNFVDVDLLNAGHITEESNVMLTNPLVGG